MNMFLRLIPCRRSLALNQPSNWIRFAPLQTSTMSTPAPGTFPYTSNTTTGTSTVNRLPRAVAVYCGANPGTVPAFRHAAVCEISSFRFSLPSPAPPFRMSPCTPETHLS